MASTTIDIDTKLSAVNSILGAIGQSPITTLEEVSAGVQAFDNPEVAFIFNRIRYLCFPKMLFLQKRKFSRILEARNPGNERQRDDGQGY